MSSAILMAKTDHEAMERSIVWVHPQTGKGTGLGCAIPAMGTVHYDTNPSITYELQAENIE